MPRHKMIDYLEFPCRDFNSTKAFFEKLFGWTFTDYGPGYSAFAGAGLDGGIYESENCSRSDGGACLIVFFSENIEVTQSEIEAAGGKVIQQIFSFPGGRRFHFCEPSGNEFAVWSDR